MEYPSDSLEGNEFIQRGVQCASEGLEKDCQNQMEEALQDYLRAIEYFFVGMQYVSPNLHDKLRKQMILIMERGEILKDKLKNEQKNSSSLVPRLPIPQTNEEQGSAHWQFLQGTSPRNSAWIEAGKKSRKSFSFKGTIAKDSHVKAMLQGVELDLQQKDSLSKLTPEDFLRIEEIPFNLSTGEQVMFISYAPKVFAHLRKKFGTNDEEFKSAIVTETLFKLKSPGRSASFFYYSSDYRYIIKTVTPTEKDHLLPILSAYYYYIHQYPETLISRFHGFYAIRSKEPNSSLMNFVIMENVFNAKYDIHKCYDLKGSTYNRYAKPSEKMAGNPVWKDLDLPKGSIKLTEQQKKQMAQQIHQDCWFLETNNLMDYSLLVGVHDREEGDVLETPNQNVPFFKRNGGGLLSSDGKQIYFIGVIDILTPYGWRKILENSFKTIYNEEIAISSVHPRLYRERFVHFLFTYCIQ